ncbi:MAG: methylenetetrahydrofolate reductase [Proteobacteria bacterium]|nr:methylenetetrahydrofolate reductase [Pseudomonadota bacterium]
MSGFVEQLRCRGRGAVPLTLEITPPRAARPEILRRRARLLGSRAAAVNAIQRPDRMTSLEASIRLKATGLDPVWHLATRGRGGAEVRTEIEAAADAGLDLALCIRGDHAAADEIDTPRVRDAVSWVREAIPTAGIGVTLNPYGPRDRVLANLVRKLEAGADFVQTQPVFSPEPLRPFAEALRRRVPGVRLVPMVMPLVTLRAAEHLRKRLGLPLPVALLRALETGGEDAGWRAFEDTLVSLRESGLADGFAIMTLETDPPARFQARLVRVFDRVLPREGR